jgi:hypothetical protein
MDGMAIVAHGKRSRASEIRDCKPVGWICWRYADVGQHDNQATRAAFEAMDADAELRDHLYRRGIRQCIDVTYALTQRQTIWEYAPRSRAAEDFDAFIRFVCGEDAVGRDAAQGEIRDTPEQKAQTHV